jgi:hypothetical protein
VLEPPSTSTVTVNESIKIVNILIILIVCVLYIYTHKYNILLSHYPLNMRFEFTNDFRWAKTRSSTYGIEFCTVWTYVDLILVPSTTKLDDIS